MPIFEKPPLETLAMAKDRWTPIYMEHGRLEVDDSSVKWLGSDGLLTRIPVATVSAMILGPWNTTITHAAVKACADCNTPGVLDGSGWDALLCVWNHPESCQLHGAQACLGVGRPHAEGGNRTTNVSLPF